MEEKVKTFTVSRLKDGCVWLENDNKEYKLSYFSHLENQYPDYGLTVTGARIPMGMIKVYRVFNRGDRVTGIINSSNEIEQVNPCK